MKWVLIIMTFSCIIAFKTTGNIWYQTYILNQTHGSINIITKGRFGFTLFNVETKNTTFIGLLNFQNNKVNFYQIQGNFSEIFTKPLQDTNSTNFVLISPTYSKTFGGAFNDVEYTLSFPIEYLFNNAVLTLGIVQ